MTETELSSRLSEAYRIVEPGLPTWAFMIGNPTLHAWDYSGALRIAVRGTTAITAGVPDVSCIAVDSGGNVGVGSAFWVEPTRDEIRVWDVESDTVYTYSVADGKFVCQPGFLDGKIYWIESPVDLADTWFFKSANADLTGVTTIRTLVTVTSPVTLFYEAPEHVLLHESAMLCDCEREDGTGGTETMLLRFPLDGGVGVFDFNERLDHATLFQQYWTGLPDLSDQSLWHGNRQPGGQPAIGTKSNIEFYEDDFVPDDNCPVSEIHWPREPPYGAPWFPDPEIAAAHASLSGDRLTVSCYYFEPGDQWMIVAPASRTSGVPDFTYRPDKGSETDAPFFPTHMFLK